MGLGITHTYLQLIALDFAFEVSIVIRDFTLILFVLSVFIFYSLVMHEGGRLAGFAEASAIYESMSQ